MFILGLLIHTIEGVTQIVNYWYITDQKLWHDLHSLVELYMTRCEHGKVDQKVLQYTEIIIVLVKGLKVATKRCLNWISFFFVVELNSRM